MELGVTGVMLPELDFDEQIALCRKLNVRYYQYRPRIIPEDWRDKPFANPWGNHKFDLTPQRFAKEGAQLTRKLRDNGLEPWGTVPALGVDGSDDQIKLHVEGAALAEARCVRCNPPAYPKQVFDYGEYVKRTIDRYASVVRRISAPAKIKLIIETHVGLCACSPAGALDVCQAFSSEHVGVIFDMANFPREGEVAPVLAVSILGAYIDCVHIGGSRRVSRGYDEHGARLVDSDFCRLEDSEIHVPSWIDALKQGAPNAPLIIEDYEPNLTGTERLQRSTAYLHRLRN